MYRIQIILSFITLFSMSSFTLNNIPWTVPEKANSQVNPIAKGDKSISQGKKIFTAYCTSCHGAEGKGNGPASSVLNPKPANFMDKVVQEQTDGSFFWKISEGRGQMSSYKTILTTEQRWHVVNYIRTLKK